MIIDIIILVQVFEMVCLLLQVISGCYEGVTALRKLLREKGESHVRFGRMLWCQG